jgi:hypothetical protein
MAEIREENHRLVSPRGFLGARDLERSRASDLVI